MSNLRRGSMTQQRVTLDTRDRLTVSCLNHIFKWRPNAQSIWSTSGNSRAGATAEEVARGDCDDTHVKRWRRHHSEYGTQWPQTNVRSRETPDRRGPAKTVGSTQSSEPGRHGSDEAD